MLSIQDEELLTERMAEGSINCGVVFGLAEQPMHQCTLNVTADAGIMPAVLKRVIAMMRLVVKA